MTTTQGPEYRQSCCPRRNPGSRPPHPNNLQYDQNKATEEGPSYRLSNKAANTWDIYRTNGYAGAEIVLPEGGGGGGA
jgi:hypothetical protein